MNGIFLLLGTNLGDRLANLKESCKRLEQEQVLIYQKSPIYESEPWGIANQPWFLNVVLHVETELSPFKLLETALGVEKEMGRIRKIKWGERLIDIDILFYHEQVITQPGLTLPHPEITNRRFTLMPLDDLVPQQRHPRLQKTISRLLEECTDPLTCKKTNFTIE